MAYTLYGRHGRRGRGEGGVVDKKRCEGRRKPNKMMMGRRKRKHKELRNESSPFHKPSPCILKTNKEK